MSNLDTVSSVFQIISCYFTNLFYNDHYERARQHLGTSNSTDSLTNAYVKILTLYIRGIKGNLDKYTELIRSLQAYYMENTNYSNVSLTSFIDKIVQQYLPEEYFAVMHYNQKEVVLSNVMTELLDKFVIAITKSENLHLVIDDHENEDNPRLWVEINVNIQKLIRDNYFHKFIRKHTGAKDENVSLAVVEGMQKERDKIWAELQRKVAENITLQKELAQAKSVAEELYRRLAEQSQQMATPRQNDLAATPRQNDLAATPRQNDLAATPRQNDLATNQKSMKNESAAEKDMRKKYEAEEIYEPPKLNLESRYSSDDEEEMKIEELPPPGSTPAIIKSRKKNK